MEAPVQPGGVPPAGPADHDNLKTALSSQDPLGDECNAMVKYKTMNWYQAGMVMVAETISLGILALPKALSTLGLVPGVFTIVFVGLISSYTGYTLGQFKRKYPHVHSMADAGGLLAGNLGRRVLGFSQLVLFIFTMGSHILTYSIMMNVLGEHSTCTILYSAIGLLVSYVLTLPRRLERISRLSALSFVSIIGAVLTSMIGVAVTKTAHSHIPVIPTAPAVHDACLALANIVFAFAGHVAFFTLFSELKDIEDFPKAVLLLQICEAILYTVSAIVIYVYVGPSVSSPALNSAGLLFRKISYGIAIPTIVIGGVVNAHVAVKFLYVRILRGTNSVHHRSLRARAAWVGISLVLWITSWLIAEGIPVFNDVLGFASSLFGTWFTFGLPGLFWLYLERQFHTLKRRQWIQHCFNVFLVALAGLLCVVGMYASIRSIIRNLHEGIGGGSFSCVDNSIY